jgi:hypothetical protein
VIPISSAEAIISSQFLLAISCPPHERLTQLQTAAALDQITE